MKNTELDISKTIAGFIVFSCALSMGTVLFIGQAAVSASAQAPIVNFVHVGGADIGDPNLPGTEPGADKNFSLVAFRYADGTAGGTLIDRWLTAGPWGVFAEIDCVFVEGNNAWVSGVVTEGSFPDENGNAVSLVGLFVRARVEDNGRNNDPTNPDRISILGFRNPAANPVPFNCNLKPNQTKHDMPRGQVTIR